MSNGLFDVPPEQLRDTMTKVMSAMADANALGAQANSLVEEVVHSGAFRGAASGAALETSAQINQDLQRILHHGSFLAEHLGQTAAVVEEGDAGAVTKIQAVFNGVNG